jgi:phage portal protein BeeE
MKSSSRKWTVQQYISNTAKLESEANHYRVPLHFLFIATDQLSTTEKDTQEEFTAAFNRKSVISSFSNLDNTSKAIY